MTKRKRKEKHETDGVNENSHTDSVHSKSQHSAKSENMNHELKRNTRNTKGKSFQTTSDSNIKNSDSDTSDRISTRRSLRRPASTSDDSSPSTPPQKKFRKTSDYSTSSNTGNESDHSNEQYSDTRNRKNTDDEFHSDASQENLTTNRHDSKTDRKRKRKLVDINEESTVSDPQCENDRHDVDQSPQKTLEKNSNNAKDKRETKGTKKRRKGIDTPNNSSNVENNETDPTRKDPTEYCQCPEPGLPSIKPPDQVQAAKKDENVSEYCRCPIPGYPSSESQVNPKDWETWCELDSDVKGDILCNRTWKQSDSQNSVDDGSCFSLLSYNILAESLLKTSHYFPKISASHWNQENRHKLLMKELKSHNADIICLQEVEKGYQPQLSKDLLSLGYQEFFACSESPGRSEGVAIYYRLSRFSESLKKAIPFSEIAESLIIELNIPEEQRSAIREYACEPQMFQCMVLKCKNSGKEICIGNAHISYAKHKKPDLRCVQIARSIDHIISFSSDQESKEPLPFIFCGDFNSIPTSAAYQLCRDGYLNDAMLNFLQQNQNLSFENTESKKSLVNVLWKAFQHSAHDLQSCYFDVLNREPPMTLNLEGNTGCVDYIWYTNSGLTVDAVLIPRSCVIRKLTDAIPNADFPSDHLSLCARLSFK